MIKTNFNKNWGVSKAAGGLLALFGGKKPEVTPVNLPHDAMITSNRSPHSPAGPGIAYFEPGDWQYTKTYHAAPEDEGKIICLEFEGVYMNASVEVNGHIAGKNAYGYTGFLVKISDFLRYGQDNEIKVIVKNSAQSNGRWYTGAGIYRNVHLHVGPAMHIKADGLRITTMSADDSAAAMEVEADVAYEGVGHRSGYLVTTISDPEGQVVRVNKSKFNIFSNESIIVRQRVTVETPALWNVDTPNLYHCHTAIEVNGEVTDAACSNFGIRTLQLDAINGLRINGARVNLKGGCIHHDNGLVGAATFEDSEERRVKLMKEAGYNALRSAHNPTSRAMLDACDKLGFLVMDEFADTWNQCKNPYDYGLFQSEWWEKDIENMVRVCYNHPSVIMYSIGNEIPELGSEFSAGLGRKYVEKFRALDRSRFITNGINILLSNMHRVAEIGAAVAAERGMTGGKKPDGEAGTGVNEMMSQMRSILPLLYSHPIATKAVEESAAMLDIIGYNYSAARYENEHEEYPDHIFVGSETAPPALDVNWALVEKHSYVLGDFSWTAWDYMGEAGIGRTREREDGKTGIDGFMGDYPWLIAYAADFDITGFRRPISYWREIIWGGRKHTPYIAVQRPQNIGKNLFFGQWSWTDSINSWTWPGYEGAATVAEVYTDAEEAELFVNGTSFGKKTVGSEFKLFYCKWDVNYEPGELVAVTYVGGQEMGRYTLKTANIPKLDVRVDKSSLRVGTNDLCHVIIELRDENGTLDMSYDRMIKVSLEGPAILQGCGSANPCTEERYDAAEHLTYEGRMMAVLRAGDEPGVTKLIVSCEGIGAVAVAVSVEEK